MKQQIFRILVILSLTLNLIGLMGSFMIVQIKGGLPWLSRIITEGFQPKKAEIARGDYGYRESVFEQLPAKPTDIIFLGDSILNIGEWHEFLNDQRAKNRAISGDDTHTVLKRLTYITEGRPRHVVLLIGINNFQKRIPYAQTMTEYAQIVATISFKSPNTDIWLIPLLPVNTFLYRKWIVPDHPGISMPPKDRVQALNAFIKKLAVDSPHIHFVEMPELLGDTGELQDVYTIDGLHLNGLGLKIIADRLKNLTITEKPNLIGSLTNGRRR